ncbi:segregation and condensation protein A [Pseudomonadota bacterium]
MTVESQNTENPAVEDLSAVVRGKHFNEWPKDLYIPPDALEVFLETFQGPLDLLLYLIRKQNLDILDIPVAEVTRQYVEYVELMRQMRLDLAAEYLVMAAVLAEIKSRMLLPRPESVEEDEQDPRAALVHRLQEYERFREAAFALEELPRLERDIFLGYGEFVDETPPEKQPDVSLDDLVSAFKNVVELAALNQGFSVEREVLSVRERMTKILSGVGKKEFLRFEEIFEAREGRMGLVVSFIAILELLKENMLVAVQADRFAPIHLRAVQ